MSAFFRLFQHLLPKSFAWKIVSEKFLRKWFEGLVPSQIRYKLFLDKIFEDLDPQTTRELDRWEKQFGIRSFGTEIERRNRLNGLWKLQGGQCALYLQNILHDAGFTELFVHESWYEDADEIKVRNPAFYLSPYPKLVFDAPEAVFDAPEAVFDYASSTDAYLLVNRGPGFSYIKPTAYACFDEPEAVFDEPEAVFDEEFGYRFVDEEYQIPQDPDLFKYFFYIGAENFPEIAEVEREKKVLLESLILKYFPARLWGGMLIKYV